MSAPSFSRILVPLDGSRLAEQILPIVSGIVRYCGGELILLHVLEPTPPAQVHGEPHLATATEAARYLEDVSRQLATHAIATRIVIVSADREAVATCIARQARALEVDGIALTNHGRGGLHGLLFGRIAQHVLQRAELPTLVVRALRTHHRALQPVTIQRLLVPLDGTRESERALPLSWHLASCLLAPVVLVRIVPTLERLSLSESAPAVFLPSATAALLEFERKQAEQELQRLAATFPTGSIVSITVRQGDVVDELAQLTTEADLVVMATHGRAGLPGWLAGSVAARLLERISVPLLLIPINEG